MSSQAPIQNTAQWPMVALADVTTKIGSGATPRGGSETYLPTRETFAFIRSQNVFDRRFDSSSVAFISDEQAARLRNAHVRPGDLLLNITGDGITFGRAALVDEAVLPACVNQHVAIIRADPKKAVPGYLLAFLTHPAVKPYVGSFSSGGSRRAVTKGHIGSFLLPLPPLETQRAIAATLGALDDKIESNRRAVDLAMKLVDTIAERESKTLPSAPLGDLASLSRATRSPAALGDALVEHFSLPAFDATGQPECVRASTIKSNKADVASNAVLVSRLNPRIPRMWWVHPRPNVPALASTEFAVLTADSDIELAGIWLAVRGPSFREELPRRVTGTSGSHQRVRSEDLLDIDVADVRQLDSETKLTALNLLTLCAARRNESAHLAALRDTLLPELLSGRIRTGTWEWAN